MCRGNLDESKCVGTHLGHTPQHSAEEEAGCSVVNGWKQFDLFARPPRLERGTHGLEGLKQPNPQQGVVTRFSKNGGGECVEGHSSPEHESAQDSTPGRTRSGHDPRGALHRGSVEFVRDLADWAWFATLTFDRDIPPQAAHAAVKRYLNQLARDCEHRHVRVALGCGLQTGGRIHYHLLLAPLDGGDFSTSTHAAERLWRLGNAQVEPVRDQGGAADYLVGHGSWITAVACDRSRPCRRKRGCRYDAPWPSLGEVTAP